MSGSLIAQGVPDSLMCRHCDAVKVRIRGALLCRRCDAPEHARPTWEAS